MAGESITDSGAGTATAATDTSGGDAGEGQGSYQADTSEVGELGGEGEAAKAAGDKAAAKAEAKRRHVRWLGRDMELSEDEMAQRFDDDYEWEFHGVGGKPLMRDGKPVKMKWPEIARAVQMSNGAADAARRANEARKAYEEKIAWARDPENTFAFIESELGIEDVNGLVLKEASKRFERRKQLIALSQTDPVAYEAELRREYESNRKQREAAQQRLQQSQQQQAQREQQRAAFKENLGRELQALKVPMNARTMEIAKEIAKSWHEAGVEGVGFPEIAGYVRDQYRSEVLSYLDGHDDESLLKTFGDKRRERLRKAEIAALKLAKKQAAPAPTAATKAEPRNQASGMTAEEFMRQSRRGRA